MDSIFQVKSHEFSGFDNFILPGNMGTYWKSQGGVGESLVLDDDKGELVKSTSNLGKKDTSKTKNVAALRSHCEAERRRRERINGHLATLRNFVPCTDKMDKATLLAEVINQVKVMEKQAKEASKGLLIPTDADELAVEAYNDHQAQNGVFAFRVSLCCDYKPDLIPDLRQVMDSLKLTITKTEISTLGSRVKSVFLVTGCKQEIADDRAERFAKSIRQALRSVLDKISASEEYSPRTTFTNKKRRVSFFDNLSPSSL